MNQPLVSIIMTTYNPVEEYLKLTIDSVIKQHYSNWELIIIDDGSQTDVGAVIKEFSDARIIFKRCEINRGISACMNEALSMAKGSMFAKMDDDDIAYPNWLAVMLAYFEAHPEANVLGCDLKLSGEKEGFLIRELQHGREKQQAEMIIQNGGIPHPMCMIRKEFLDKYQIRYDTRYKSSVDYALWVEIVKYSRLDSIPEVLGIYRRHQKQISTKTYSAQQNFADEIRWNQMREFGLEPDERQRQIHNKLCRIQPLDKEDLAVLDEWLTQLKEANLKSPYFHSGALKLILHQRAATLYLRYVKNNYDLTAVKYIIKYMTIQNIMNGLHRVVCRNNREKR